MRFDPAAFDSPPADAGGLLLPESVTSAPLDIDGNPVMPMWANCLDRYNKTPAAWRARRSREWVESEIQKANAPMRESRKGVTKFSTQYAVNWGKRQKRASGLAWTVIDRENWQPSHNEKKPIRSYDLMLGLDVLFDNGEPGMIGVQAGTPGEEKAHARTFLERGGPEKAKQRMITIYWLAFERGNPEPVEKQIWTLDYLKAKWPDLFQAPKPLAL